MSCIADKGGRDEKVEKENKNVTVTLRAKRDPALSDRSLLRLSVPPPIPNVLLVHFLLHLQWRRPERCRRRSTSTCDQPARVPVLLAAHRLLLERAIRIHGRWTWTAVDVVCLLGRAATVEVVVHRLGRWLDGRIRGVDGLLLLGRVAVGGRGLGLLVRGRRRGGLVVGRRVLRRLIGGVVVRVGVVGGRMSVDRGRWLAVRLVRGRVRVLVEV